MCVPEEEAVCIAATYFAPIYLQEDSDLENYLTSVQEDMMEFKLSYEMWRVGRWTVSIPQVSYKYQRGRGMSRGPAIALLRLVLGYCAHG